MDVAFSSSVFATNSSVVDDIDITIPISCSMGGTIDTNHTATLQNGTYSAASGSPYENGIGKTTLTTFCNDVNGFAVYAVGFTGETIEGGDNNKLVGVSSGLKINTGVYTSGDTDSSWSMKVNKITDSSQSYNPNNLSVLGGYDNWHTVPTEYTKVANYQAETGSSATDTTLGSKLTTTYAAYVSTTQAADTYQGKVKYVLVHPSTGPNPGMKVMQNVASWKNTLTVGQEIQALDSRDNKVYTVAKLADGNIWMTQNLDLDLDSTKTYTSADTDLPNNTTWTPMRSTYPAGDSTWEWSETEPESADPGSLYWSGTLNDGTPVSSGNSHYHLGNYYNWTAAVAMNDSSSYYTDNVDVNQSICPAGWRLPLARGGEIDPETGDVIPEDDQYSFYRLLSQYGWNDYQMTNPHAWESPLYFPLSGGWNGGLSDVGSNGYFWSSVVGNDDGARGAYFSTSGRAYPADYNNRNYGYSVRCVAR